MDLANPQNWSIVFSVNKRAQPNVVTNADKLGYFPLTDEETTLATPIGLVSLSTTEIHKNSGKPYHGTGAWLNVFLPIAGVESRVYKRTCPINTSILIQLPNYGVFPYKLKFSFSYWFEQIEIVVRQFTDQSGRYLDQDEAVLFSAIEVAEQRDAEMARQIEILTQRLTQGG